MRIIRMIAILLSAAAAAPRAADHTWTLTSPDTTLHVAVRLDAHGALRYEIVRSDGAERHTVLAWSPLGLTREDQAFVQGLRFSAATPAATIDDAYVAPHGKRRAIRHRANERVLSFANGAGVPVDVIVRVADDGAAFRYRFPGSDATPRTVTGEHTGFAVPAGSTGWMLPRVPPGKYAPAYEDLFVEVRAGQSAPTPAGWDYPALFRVAGGREWLLVTEAGLDESYAATRLGATPDGTVYRVHLPEPGEGLGVGRSEPASPLPWTLPWRVVIVGRTLATVFESTLVNDLSPASVVADTSWVRPGRASWSWWSDDDSPKSEAALTSFIDFGAEMGWEYSLIDANWNLMDPAALERVLARAREKHVGVLLWYNSGGPHNDVTEQPRDRMHQRDVRRKEFARLREWGIKGVKVDFWQSDKQDRIRQYLELLRDAADFQLMVDPHGCTLPRGWSRTYPHLMTMEAVAGAEQYKFNEAYPAKAAWHNTVLAFTRNVVGPMDYTPVTFSDSKFPHLTTYGHELALAIVFESGLQHYADGVSAYRALPADALTLLKEVPAAWEESRLLAGSPGSLVVVARKGVGGWFLGGISGQDAAQTVRVDLSPLGPGPHTLRIVRDGDGPRALTSETRTVKAGERLVVELLPRGGFAASTAHAGP
jgi:alpha-glucosidase